MFISLFNLHKAEEVSRLCSNGIRGLKALLLIFLFFMTASMEAQERPVSGWPNDSISNIWEQYLDEFVVTATRTPKTLSSAPILTRLIGEAEIRSAGFENVTEVLEYHLPGISFKKDGRGINLQIQGLDNDYILILIDGERLSATAGGNIDQNRIALTNIRQIEIVKGAASVLYGSNAIGMVINIITKEPQRTLEGSAFVQYGRFQNTLIELGLGGKWGNWSALTSLYFNSSKGYNLNPSNLQVYTINPFRNTSINQKLWWKKGDTKFTGGFSYYQNDIYNPPLSIIEERYKSNYLTFSLKAEQEVQDHRLSLSYHTDLYRRHTVVGKEVKRRPNTESDRHTIRLMDHLVPIEELDVVMGSELNFNRDYSDFRFGQDTPARKVHDINLFAQGDWKFLQHFDLTGGVRYTHHSVFGNAFTPKINLMYSPGALRLRMGYSRGFKAPDATELFSDFMMGTVSHNIGNPDLKAERSQYGYLSVEYRKNGFAISAEAYQNHIREKIQSNFVQITNPDGTKKTELRYSNIGNVQIRGIQISTDFYPLPFLMLRANYAYTDAINLENGMQLKGNAKHAINGSVGVKGNIVGMKSALTLAGRWTSEKSNDLEQRTINKLTGEEEVIVLHNTLRPYSIWRITGQITPFERGNMSLTLSLGIQNIFDFTDPEYYTTFDPGRRLLGTIIFNF